MKDIFFFTMKEIHSTSRTRTMCSGEKHKRSDFESHKHNNKQKVVGLWHMGCVGVFKRLGFFFCIEEAEQKTQDQLSYEPFLEGDNKKSVKQFRSDQLGERTPLEFAISVITSQEAHLTDLT